MSKLALTSIFNLVRNKCKNYNRKLESEETFFSKYKVEFLFSPQLFQTANALIADAVGLYAYAMNDLGNVQPLQFEALNCKGGARWSSGEKLLEYLKGVSTKYVVI